MQKVEESFNYVWYVAKPRSFARRFTEYMIVLLVGPLLMVTALGILTSIQSATVVQFILNNEALGPSLCLAGKLVPYLLISGVFTFLYMFMPNTKVNLRPRWSAALLADSCGPRSALFSPRLYLYATRTAQIYAGFAVGISALIWLYMNWLILLIGAQLAFYHQRPAFLRSGRQEPRLSNAMRERLALNVMFHVGMAFRDSDASINASQISNQINIPSIALTSVIASLENAGLITSTEKENLLPGREMSRIPLAEILEVVRVKGETGSHRDPKWSRTVDELASSSMLRCSTSSATVHCQIFSTRRKNRSSQSGSRDRHAVDEHRATPDAPTQILIAANCDDLLIQVPQIAGDCHFMHGISDFTILDPKTDDAA